MSVLSMGGLHGNVQKVQVIPFLFWIIPKEVLIIIFKNPVAPLENKMYPCVRFIQKPNKILKSDQGLFFNPTTGKIYVLNITNFVGPHKQKTSYQEVGPADENTQGQRNTLMFLSKHRRFWSNSWQRNTPCQLFFLN